MTRVKCLAVLQARTSSSRLPGKVLMPILGRPLIALQIERLARSECIDHLTVATSDHPSDDALVDLCTREGIDFFRGSLNDVLDRFVQAARRYDPEVVVRLTGDCPLADPEVIDIMIRYFYEGNYDYVSNGFPPTFPDGLDAEVIRFACLEQAHREAVLPSHREHVTPFLRAYPDRFRLGNYEAVIDRSKLRWTVDEQEDFEFVRKIYERLYARKADFSTDDVLKLLEQEPELGSINDRYTRNEGTKKSLLADAEFLAKKG